MRRSIALATAVLGVIALGLSAPVRAGGPDGFFSSESNQFVGFFTYILQQNVYGANGEITDPFPTFLPGHLGLDAVDVLVGVDDAGDGIAPQFETHDRPPILFSTESNGFVWHAGGLIYIEQDLPYCLMPNGEIIEVPNWSHHGTEIGTLDALAAVPRSVFEPGALGGELVAAGGNATTVNLAGSPDDGLPIGPEGDGPSGMILFFSVESNRFAYFPGGQIYLRQQNAYAFDPWNGRIWRFFNGKHKGLRSLDAFDVALVQDHDHECVAACLSLVGHDLLLGPKIISTETNQFAHGYYLRQNRAYLIGGFGGEVFLDPGANSLDAVSAARIFGALPR